MIEVLAVSENPDGGVSVTTLAPKYIKERMIVMLSRKHKKRYLESISDNELIDLITQKELDKLLGDILEETRVKLGVNAINRISREEMPTDRYFRNAWKKRGSGVEVDMPKAREIQMKKIRKLRDEKLKKLDIETMKGNDVQAEKQVLRDIPQNFDLSVAKTPEELKNLMPNELK